MSLTEQLFAIEQIKKVKSKYAFSADQKEWDDFASVFAPDAMFDESHFPGVLKPFTKEPASSTISARIEQYSAAIEWPIVGRDAIRDQPRASHAMIHHILDPSIELTSDSTATARFRYESHHWFPEGGPMQYMHNFGYYHETYVLLDDGRWYIKTLRLERLRVECR